MTDEQKAAYVNAQTALLLVELEGMKALNAYRESRGFAQAYDEKAFEAVGAKFGHLQHNALMGLFNGD